MEKIGLQLYSIRQELEKDFWGSLKKVKQAGYDCVEFAGFYGHTAQELKSGLADLGLEPYTAHASLGDPTELVKFAAALGLKYVIAPGLPSETPEACQESNKVLREAAKVFAAEGIVVGYHNHWHEFYKIDGRYALEVLMDGVDGIFEIDTAWVKKGGEDPLAYIRSLGNRVGPIHTKDINADYLTRDPAAVNACIGEGVVDFKGIIGHLRSIGTLSRGLIVEQEAFTIPMFDALAKNVQTLRSLLG